MENRIENLNRTQMGSKRPVINKENIRFEWEDTDLLPLLHSGIRPLYPQTTSEENQTAERESVRLVNGLIRQAGKDLDYGKFEQSLDALISSHDGYVSGRLKSLKYSLIDKVRARKGLLIYGEGGIGKTYFLYELAQNLNAKRIPYAIAFNQEGVVQLSELDLKSIASASPVGFTLLVDACNELDDESFGLARQLIEDILKTSHANVVVTTRSESPTSRIEELQSLLPTSIEFQGVSPDLVFSSLADGADELVIHYQDMLFSRNARNLSVMLKKIREFRPGEDGLNATTQRTALIERCIKDALSEKQWLQTKEICRFLLDRGTTGFSKAEVESILGDESNRYLSGMIEQGFIEFQGYKDGEIRYFYSSESQIRYVIARGLNVEFERLNSCDYDEDELIDSIAKLVEEKSSCINDREMIQVAVDRYLGRGPAFIAGLLERLEQYGMAPDWETLLTQTIFPLDWDFDAFVDACEVDIDWAFLHFGGILNTPFNLMHYTNNLFLADESLVDDFFLKKWERHDLEPIISRARNITGFVSRTGRVPASAISEWVWFSIWTSFSSNMTLRAVSQRLMFFLCDANGEALREVIGAWGKISDVFAKRAIAKAISHLDEETKDSEDVKRFVADAVCDESLTDYVVIASICQISKGRIAPMDFKARNIYLELEGCNPTEKELKSFIGHADMIDLHHKNFFPFDIHKVWKGCIDFGYRDSFISAFPGAIEAWNNSLRGLLNCQPEGECCGRSLDEADFRDFLPIDFEREPLDQQRLMSCMVLLTKTWLERYGGDFQRLLGSFEPLIPYRSVDVTPNSKPFDLAAHELLGSLASNFYVDRIVLGDDGYTCCGFSQYDERPYNEPGIIHTPTPTSHSVIDSARPKIERRFVSPEGKEREWFDDKEEAFSEILDIISSVKIGKTYWQPIALSTSNKIYSNDDIQWSNEFVISIAFDCGRHIEGFQDDRRLTIEHRSFEGNIKDYGHTEGSLCLYLDAPDEHCTFANRNSILLPPPSLVRRLDLSFDRTNACFVERSSGNPIVVCDGAPGNFYEDPVHNLILIRKDVYDELVRENLVTFFAFSERLHKDDGFTNDCDRHWEFRPDGALVADYPNDSTILSSPIPESCGNCRFSTSKQTECLGDDSREIEEENWPKMLIKEYAPPAD